MNDKQISILKKIRMTKFFLGHKNAGSTLLYITKAVPEIVEEFKLFISKKPNMALGQIIDDLIDKELVPKTDEELDIEFKEMFKNEKRDW